MVDKNFYDISDPIKLIDLAKSIDCQLDINTNQNSQISAISTIEDASSNDLVMLNNKKYTAQLHETKAAACITKEQDYNNLPSNLTILNSQNPYYSYALAINLFYKPKKPSSSPKNIHDKAIIGTNPAIHHTAIIEEDVVIGNNAQIGPYTVISRGVKIGNNARIESHTTINYSIIGDNAVILSGAKIGQDGFGFATEKGRHLKIFHVGRVIIGNDVEIGSNTTIDRGSIKDTKIEDYVRIDNLVQIGHNVTIGKGSIIVAQVGIAGSSTIGNYCALGGQVGVSGHITIADQVQVSGQGGVIQDIKQEKQILGGTPAMPIREWHKQSVFLKRAISRKTGQQ